MSHRQEKVNSLLQQELGAIILREIEFPANVFVTILAVKTAEDYKQARIIISVFPFDKSELALEILNKNIYHIQQILNKKLRMRPVPRIFFRADATEENAGKVEILLKND